MVSSVHALAEQQGIELGSPYKTTDSARLVTHFVAESQHQQFYNFLSMPSTLFFSFLIDGSTDADNCRARFGFHAVQSNHGKHTSYIYVYY